MEAVQAWHDVYLMTGTASATLVGLLFVGLSLHVQVVVRHLEVRSLARTTLSNFFTVLVISLIILAPTGEPRVSGGCLVGIAGLSLMLLVRPAINGIRGGSRKRLGLWVLLSRFWITAVCYVALGAMGLLFAAGQIPSALGGLLGIVILLLVTAVRNTWDLLVTVAGGEA